MRGRLRIIDGDTTTWAEIPMSYWEGFLEEGADIPLATEPDLKIDSEIPDYEGKTRL